MTIHIGINAENADAILEEGMNCINRVSSDRPQWKKDNYGYYKTECDVSENEILPVFKELIEKYSNLSIYATYSQEIREDDCSAQWWRSTTIKTEHHPEGTTLSIDSSTYWF